MSNDAGGGWPPGSGEGQPPQPYGAGQYSQHGPSEHRTGPNAGPTVGNPQNSYYDRYADAAGGKAPSGGPKRGGGHGKLLAAIIGVLVLFVAAIGAFVVLRDDGSTDAVSSASTSPSSLPPVTATTWTNPTKAAGARALTTGWQSQTGGDETRGQYDVPDKDWKLEAAEDLRGYADHKGNAQILARGPALYGQGFCSADKKDYSAWTGLMKIGQRDPSDAGPDVAKKFAQAIALKKDGSRAKVGAVSAGKQIKVNQGTLPALEYTVTTEVGDPSKCDGKNKFEVRTVSFSASGGSAQLVIIRMLGGSKPLSTSTVDKIVATFRPAA